MSTSLARYKSFDGLDLTLYLDVDLKSEKILDLIFKGQLVEQYRSEIASFKDQVLNLSLNKALLFERSQLESQSTSTISTTSILQWLLTKAVESYHGDSRLTFHHDVLCLCFGTTKSDLLYEITSRPDYSLTHLIAEAKATSACGSCKKIIMETMKSLREENGLIKGLSHSKSNVDSEGKWIKIKNMYPAELVIHLDQLKIKWMIREGLSEHFSIEIVNIEGHHLQISIKEIKNPNTEIDAKKTDALLSALSDYWRAEVGALFFLSLF